MTIDKQKLIEEHKQLLQKFKEKGYDIEKLPLLEEDDPLYMALANKRRTGKFELAKTTFFFMQSIHSQYIGKINKKDLQAN